MICATKDMSSVDMSSATTEGMFAAALEYMKTQSCPAVVLSKQNTKALTQADTHQEGLAIAVPSQIYNSILLENKILSRKEIK